MADQRRGGIAWTEETLNPIRARHRATGKIGWYCQRVSDGCKHCYAATMNEWRGNGVDYTVPALKEVELFLDAKILDAPLRWHRARRVFLCSMTDLFAEFVPDEWIDRIFCVMSDAPQHTFQVLTKRPDRMLAYVTDRHQFIASGAGLVNYELGDRLTTWDRSPLPNVWLGVSVEDQATADARIPLLLQTPAALRWVSYEPALAPVNFDPWLGYCTTSCVRFGEPTVLNAHSHPRIDWLVVGGESGSQARPFDLAWARSAIVQGRAAATLVFMKQIGSRPGFWGDSDIKWANAHPRLYDPKGGDPQEWPEDLRVREWPT